MVHLLSFEMQIRHHHNVTIIFSERTFLIICSKLMTHSIVTASILTGPLFEVKEILLICNLCIYYRICFIIHVLHGRHTPFILAHYKLPDKAVVLAVYFAFMKYLKRAHFLFINRHNVEI